MAQTTTDQYLSGLVRPAAQRRQRSAVLDPLESQAAMDRATDTQVSNASMPSQGGGGIIQLASNTGGGGTAVRTASMRDGDSAPVRQTAQRGSQRPPPPPGYRYQCDKGGCELVPIGGSMQSAPIRTTVTSSQPVITNERVISSRPVTTSAPMATTVSEPQNYLPSPIIPSGDPASIALGAVPLASTYDTMPEAGMTMAAVRVGLEQMGIENDRTLIQSSVSQQAVENQRYEREYPLQAENVKGIIAERAANTANKLAEVGMTETQTDLIAGSTTPGRNNQVQTALGQITAGQLSVQTFHDTMMRADSVAPMVMQDNGKTKVGAQGAPASSMSDTARSANYMRMGYSALALNVLFTNKHIENLDAPADTAQVGVSPITEAALKQKRPSPMRPGYRDDAPDISKITDDSVKLLVSNYSSGDTFNLPWNEVELLLADEVRIPLERVNAVMATNGLKPGTDAYTRAYLGAKQEAGNYYDVIRMEVRDAYNKKHLNSPGQQGSMSHGAYYGMGQQAPTKEEAPKPLGLQRAQQAFTNPNRGQ
jgi:hypothetical protein